MDGDNCCLCIKIHKGFFKIIYMDVFRLFFGLVMTIIKFSNPANNLEKVFSALSLCAISVQAVMAIASYFKGVPINNHKLYGVYLKVKIIFVVTNIIMYVLIPILNCSNSDLQKTSQVSCDSNSLGLGLTACIAWNLAELYFSKVVYKFQKRTEFGFYGPPGYSPFATHQYMQHYRQGSKRFKVIEVKGLDGRKRQRGVRPPNDVQVGLPLTAKQASYDQLFKHQTDESSTTRMQQSLIKMMPNQSYNLIGK